ncbi:MAG: hypothetical protein RLZZ60_793 [Bacteroidota bacterium]|jgi:uncharacterized membrane protein YcaP (DUF421 family)
MSGILDIVLRTVCIYLVVVVGLLILGKKELSQMSVTDLVFIMLISNAVQNAMVGSNVSLLGGVVAALVLLLLNYLFRVLNFRWRFMRQLVEGEPKILILKGHLQQEQLDREQITHEELMAAIREHGVSEIAEVSLAMLEIDGNISVVSDTRGKRSLHKRRKHSKGFIR